MNTTHKKKKERGRVFEVSEGVTDRTLVDHSHNA